jgi:hypothetical protein
LNQKGVFRRKWFTYLTHMTYAMPFYRGRCTFVGTLNGAHAVILSCISRTAAKVPGFQTRVNSWHHAGGGDAPTGAAQIVCPAIFDRNILAFGIAGLLQTLPEGGDAGNVIEIPRRAAEKANHWHRRLLRACRERPSRHATSPHHSSTSSTRISIDNGTSVRQPLRLRAMGRSRAMSGAPQAR